MTVFNFYRYDETKEKCPPSKDIITDREIRYSIEGVNLADAFDKLIKQTDDLSGIDFSKSSDWNCNFNLKKIYGKNFSYSNLENCLFYYENITNCSFKGANINNTTFNKCYGSNCDFSHISSKKTSFFETALISPIFSFSKIENGNMQGFRWCNQNEQINKVFDESLKGEQKSFSFRSPVEGTTFLNCSWEDSVVPDFIKKSIHGEKSTCVFSKTLYNFSKFSFATLSPFLLDMFQGSNNLCPTLDKISNNIHHFDNLIDGSLTNEIAMMGGVFISLHLAGKGLHKIHEHLIQKKSNKNHNFKILEKISKINHIFLSGNKKIHKKAVEYLSKNTKDFFIENWGKVKTIYCNNKDADIVLKEMIENNNDNIMFILPENNHHIPKIISFDKNGNIYFLFYQNGQVDNCIVFDKNKKTIMNTLEDSMSCDDILKNIVKHYQKSRHIEQNIVPKYNFETHFLDYQNNFIRVIDKKTLKIDNNEDWSVFHYDRKKNKSRIIFMEQGKMKKEKYYDGFYCENKNEKKVTQNIKKNEQECNNIMPEGYVLS